MSAFLTISGNVGNKIEEFSFGSGGTGLRFDVAVTDTIRGEQITKWYPVTCFGRLVETAQDHQQAGRLVTGSTVLVMGKFQPRDYQTKNGDDRTSLDVTASTLEILRWPDNRQSQQQEEQYPEPDDSDVPF